jgi:glutamate-ammonia-ligase adenylyltransferase
LPRGACTAVCTVQIAKRAAQAKITACSGPWIRAAAPGSVREAAGMASRAVDASPLAGTIEASADPTRARAALVRVFEAHAGLVDELLASDLLREGFVTVAVASRSLLQAVIRSESTLDPLRDGAAFATERTAAEYLQAVRAALADHTDPPTGLRRWKRTELFRIAARDLLGLADLPAVGRELAALAEACLAGAVGIVEPHTHLAIVAMGKLGGRELNYASDVDVVFVHEGDASEAERAARALLQVMTAPSPDGIVFRTDATLRPEGRAGSLTRSLEAFDGYYARWAQTWERQALIKARPVAGDLDLGRRFFDLVQPYVWPEALDPEAVRQVRAMKARSEAVLERQGLTDRELKRGAGGIRDIEFAVQLLQMVHGRHDAALRSPTTLDALDALAAGGYVDHADAETLDDAYRFLRTTEHRLQLVDEQQTHTLPADPGARTLLARVMGYRDGPEHSALEQFDVEHRTLQARVRSIHERLFFQPLLEAVAGAGPLSPDAAQARLTAFGFVDAQRTRDALTELTHGFTRRSRLMQQVLPVLLAWLSETPDPDLGLLELRRLAEGPDRSAFLARNFRDAPGAAERVCRVLGSSRVLGEALRRHPEFVATLGDKDALAQPLEGPALVAAAIESTRWRADPEQRRDGLRRFKRRQLLHVGSRDVLGFADVDDVGRELSALADAAFEAAFQGLHPEIPFAVIGMGRLGGRELSYASDVDVLFVYDGHTPAEFDMAERIATRFMREIGQTTAEGQAFRIDAGLRPEGRHGPLARSLDGYRTYYERWALTWEFQSLLRARPVTGDPDVGQRFRRLVESHVYRDDFDEESAREVRRMKARVERERIPPGEDPQFHLKLGRGSLSDVEFTVQLLQLQHAGTVPSLREPSTVKALQGLRDAGVLEPQDADALLDAYRFCERARNAAFLLTGRPTDSLPGGRDGEHLARRLGYSDRPDASLRDDYRRVTRRARRVVERVFYGSA